MRKQQQAYLYAGAAVLCWSTVATAFKLALRGLGPLELLCYAACASACVLTALLLIQGGLAAAAGQSKSDWLRSAGLGFLNPLLYYLVLFKAYDLLPAQEAQPLNYTWPVVLSLLSAALLGQRLSARSFAALLTSFAGVIVISTRGRLADIRFACPLGTALAVGSSVIWALFWILNLRDPRAPTVKLWSASLFGAAYSTVLLVCVGRGEAAGAGPMLAACYAGVFEMGVTFVLWLNALRLSSESALVSNLAYLSPFLSLVFIRFVLGEDIRASSIAGLTLIVAGILIQTVRAKAPAASHSRT